jgi:hypothetical protein
LPTAGAFSTIRRHAAPLGHRRNKCLNLWCTILQRQKAC